MTKLRLLFILLLIFFAGCEPMPEDVYKVVKIKDGDTIELLSSDFKNITVRLSGIDCPEKAQPFGQAAKNFTALLCFGKNVKLQVDDTDRYGRTVGTIFLDDGRNLNYEIVSHGFAWQYKAYSKDPELTRLEEQAREQKTGLWQDPNPIEPWNFRRKKTKKKPRKKRKPKTEVVSLMSFSVKTYEVC